MILSDQSIIDRMLLPSTHLARIEIDPAPTPDDIQGASVDLRLGAEVIYRGNKLVLVKGTTHDALMLSPGGTCLAMTSARIHTPHDCVARVEGKSSIGRQFVVVHCTAGFIDPGFDGYITLELANLSDMHSFLLEPDMPICQITFIQMDRPSQRQYRGKYQNALGVQANKP